MPKTPTHRPLDTAASRAAATMMRSLKVPTEMAMLAVPARVMVENRLLVNDHLEMAGSGRISFSHLIAFAVVRACDSVPVVNVPGDAVNLGLLVDVQGPDGRRQIRAPSIKGAESQRFEEFRGRYDDLVRRARTQGLSASDSLGTTISLTNPGTLGTSFSVPRLMPRQRMLVGAGAVGFPATFAGTADEVRHDLAVSEVVRLTATYDARSVTEATAGEFLRAIADLLTGEQDFYDEVFGSLGLAAAPYRWAGDVRRPDGGHRLARLVDAYRRHRHRAADHGDLGFAQLGFTVWDLPRRFHAEALDLTAPLREIIRSLRLSYCYRR